MKNIITIILCSILIGITFYYLNPLTNKLSNIISKTNTLVINEANNYKKNNSYLFVSLTDDYIPYSYQDILNIYYSVINNGWSQFTFYCPSEYKDCLEDVEKISGDNLILTHLNNYVHPFNSFTNVQTLMKESGEITLNVYYLYDEEKIKMIDNKVNELLNSLITKDMSDFDKIKTVHDYIINNVKYDVERNEENTSKYNSYTAYGPLFEGLATCNGYTDLMAIFLTKMGFNNYKIATTPEEISYAATGHIWNAVYVQDEEGNFSWRHLDLTWDDPVSSDGKDNLFHDYFLVTTEGMHSADNKGTAIEEHNFNPRYYLEFMD